MWRTLIAIIASTIIGFQMGAIINDHEPMTQDALVKELDQISDRLADTKDRDLRSAAAILRVLRASVIVDEADTMAEYLMPFVEEMRGILEEQSQGGT